MCFIRPTDSGRVSKVREFTLYPTLIFPVDKAPAASTPLHGGGGGVCCCSRSTSSCCRRLPPPVPLCCPASLCVLLLLQTVCCGQTYREAEGITKASRQRLRESRASVSALHKKKVNSSTIEIRVVWSVNYVMFPTEVESICSFKRTITLQSKKDFKCFSKEELEKRDSHNLCPNIPVHQGHARLFWRYQCPLHSAFCTVYQVGQSLSDIVTTSVRG